MRKKNLNPKISIDCKSHTINVGRDVVRALERPEYVRLLQNETLGSIAIQSCDEKEVLSFKTPEGFANGRECKFRIHSKPFISAIQQSCHLWGEGAQIFSGKFMPEKDAVIFHLMETGGEEEEERRRTDESSSSTKSSSSSRHLGVTNGPEAGS